MINTMLTMKVNDPVIQWSLQKKIVNRKPVIADGAKKEFPFPPADTPKYPAIKENARMMSIEAISFSPGSSIPRSAPKVLKIFFMKPPSVLTDLYSVRLRVG